LLTDYTSYDEIRAVLGVSNKDIKDETLALALYERLLLIDLDSLDSTAGAGIRSLYATVSGTPQGSRTADQQRYFELAQVYSAYSVSNTLLTSLPYFAVKRVTDGRAEAERIADPFADVKESVPLMLSTLRRRLLMAYTVLGGVVSSGATGHTRVYFAATGLSKDPVTT
jgi:hypothetical protein